MTDSNVSKKGVSVGQYGDENRRAGFERGRKTRNKILKSVSGVEASSTSQSVRIRKN